MKGLSLSVLVVLTLTSCAVSQSRTKSIEPSQKQYELVTIEQQAKESILTTPTEFRMALEDDRVAWARVELFFQQYTKSGFKGTEPLPGGGVLVSNKKSQQDKYTYAVEKYNVRGQLTYLVECRANAQLGGQVKYCQANAQNLARFIRDGQLELSLLAR